MRLELGGMRVGGGGLLRTRSRQRSGGAAPLDWEMTALSGSRMCRSAGLAWWLAKGVQLGRKLPNQHLITREERSLGEWKGIKHTVRVRYDDSEAALEEPVAAIIL